MKPICKYTTQIIFFKKTFFDIVLFPSQSSIYYSFFYAQTTWFFGYCFILYPDFSRKFSPSTNLNTFLTIPLLCWLLYNWFIKFYKVYFGDLDQHVFKLTDLSAKMKPFQYPRICWKKKTKSGLGKNIPPLNIECQKRQFSKDK